MPMFSRAPNIADGVGRDPRHKELHRQAEQRLIDMGRSLSSPPCAKLKVRTCFQPAQ